jgi:CheY-like chemotaxis protein
MVQGPIVIIEDDPDDQEIYSMVIHGIGINIPISFFSNGTDVLQYLSDTDEQPFILISDINMPGMSGFELRRTIQEDPYLASKGIPFVFLSTNASKTSVIHANALSVQGYFEKPNNLEEMKEMFQVIFGYWLISKHINNI